MMGEYIVHLRYYPGDSLEEINQGEGWMIEMDRNGSREASQDG